MPDSRMRRISGARSSNDGRTGRTRLTLAGNTAAISACVSSSVMSLASFPSDDSGWNTNSYHTGSDITDDDRAGTDCCASPDRNVLDDLRAHADVTLLANRHIARHPGARVHIAVWTDNGVVA